MYHDPKTVLSPKDKVSSVDVVFDKGPVESSWSVARLRWGGSPAVGIRWNGDSGNNKGTPQSRGNPAWFIVPEELEEAVLEAAKRKEGETQTALAEGYRQMAADRTREAEAEEWVEGLIGDID
ncbi:MAG: hypothetical protein ACLQG3_15505 [Terracidiphilus sp.]